MLRSVATHIAIAFALTGVFAMDASAQCTPNAGPFCIDGVITPTDNSGLPPQALITPDPTGKEFGVKNGAHTKVGVINFVDPINDPKDVLALQTTATGKVDLKNVYTQAGVSGTDFWFYYAWERDTTAGSGFVAIEFQRAGVPVACSSNYDPFDAADLVASCNPWANRDGDGTAGNSDFMILWDQQGNTVGLQNIFVRFYNKSLAAFGPPQNLTLAGSAVALYANDTSSRGEVALNFSAIVGADPNECLTFANIIPNTVTGNSDSADYMDTVLRTFPLASNCGSVTVKKLTSPASSGIDFEYTLTKTPGPIFGVATADSDCSETGSSTNTCIGLVAHNQTDTIQDLLAATNYTLVESDKPSNYNLTSIICTPQGGAAIDVVAVGFLPVEATKTTACVITNTLATGELRVIKSVTASFGLDNPPGAFRYTLDGTEFYFTTTGASGGPTCTSGAVCKTLVANVGTQHTVLEPNPLAGYTATFSSDQAGHANDCTNLAISASPVTCTVTNTPTQNTPSMVTRQRVLLFDRANLSALRRVASNEPAMKITFAIYATEAACGAQSGALGSQEVPLTFPNQTDTTITAATTTGISPATSIEIKLDTAGDQTTARWWRALFHQEGVNPPNADFLTPCTEITTVRIQQ